ncbi:hypothetical protein LOD99_7765 [Oopsacas minuta]|uniref:Gustatory receptor n=1 Tax=Oopsacas minuta TaxID=111878 RepID=A0AAV7JPH4_9METZ|nr:hypothetical protein LOD99_7765 [Oopsacas minuta]
MNYANIIYTKEVYSCFCITYVGGNNLLEFIIATIYTLKGIFYPIIFHFALILQSFYIPILCLLLKVLWLAYLHSQYKYTIMRWTVYITLRLVAIYIVHSWQFVYVSNNDIKVNISLLIFTYLHSVFQTIDLFTYILYSRRFYLHLKSREIEAKLFDEDKYLQSKYVRVHFKIATFIVTIALSLYTLSEGIFCLFSLSINISKFVNEVFIFSEWEYYLQSLLISRYALLSAYRILLDVNYMYVFLVIMFKYCRQKHQLTRINDRIHPYVREYQDQVFTRYL